MILSRKLIIKSVAKLRTLFLDLIFPIECLNCGQEKVWLCDQCLTKIKFKRGQYCLHCKKENKSGQFCLNCSDHYALDGVLIASVYDEQIVAKLIKVFKYHFARDIAEVLSRFLILFLDKTDKQNKELLFNKNLVISVPLSNRRKRWRGFNQAEEIAKKVARHFNIEICDNELIRIKHKKPQVKLGEKERINNVKGCFFWQGDNLAGRNIIIIDDVVTTGATLNECARILKQNGAGTVWGLVVAKG